MWRRSVRPPPPLATLRFRWCGRLPAQNRYPRVTRDAARYVHWGASSQDPDRHRDDARTARRHRRRCLLDIARGRSMAFPPSPAAIAALRWGARTGLQHALPISFGLKLAGYAAALARSRERLRAAPQGEFGAAIRRRGRDARPRLASMASSVTDRLAALLDLPAAEAAIPTATATVLAEIAHPHSRP